MDGEVGYYYQQGAHFRVELPVTDTETPESGGHHENA
ncbi:hypothetical protein [Marinobacter metalliresistant]